MLGEVKLTCSEEFIKEADSALLSPESESHLKVEYVTLKCL